MRFKTSFEGRERTGAVERAKGRELHIQLCSRKHDRRKPPRESMGWGEGPEVGGGMVALGLLSLCGGGTGVS